MRRYKKAKKPRCHCGVKSYCRGLCLTHYFRDYRAKREKLVIDSFKVIMESGSLEEVRRIADAALKRFKKD